MFKIFFLLMSLSLYLFGAKALVPLSNSSATDDFKLFYYFDTSHHLTHKEICTIDFKEETNNKYSLGYHKSTLWFKVTLFNPTENEEFILSLNEHFYETAELYYYNEKWEKKETGFFTPLDQREIKTSKLNFKIDLKPNTSQTYYIKLQGKYSYFGNITIIPKELFVAHQFFSIDSFYIFALGMVFIIILYNLFLWIKLKEALYGFYVGYMVSIFIYMVTMSSFLVYFNYQDLTYKLHLSGMFSTAFLALFSLIFLDVKNFFKKLYFLIIALIVILFLSAVAQFFYYTPWNQIINQTIILINITLIITSFLIYFKGELHIKYYVFALVLVFIFVALFTSMLTGAIQYTFITRYGYVFAICFEVTVFSLMLAERYNIIKNKQLQTQKKLLTLQQNQKELLEKEVNDKTKELSVLLEERELLLKEVFHRVKNNFHMVTAFLWLESQKEGNKHRFDELINRIQSMSLIHEYLCQNKDLTHIDTKEYLHTLIEILTKAHKNVEIRLDIDSFVMSFGDMVSLSVILNEVISNSVKHNPNTSVILHITCKYINNSIELSIQDNGTGFNTETIKKGFGLKLIEDFTNKLPEAHIFFNAHHGCLFTLKFKLREHNEAG